MWNEINAILRPELSTNWISKKIVKQYKFQQWRGKAAKEAVYDGITLVSTGKVVDLSCPQKNCRHRFYITENPAIGILYGEEFCKGKREVKSEFGTQR
jgi:hypothetical protein